MRLAAALAALPLVAGGLSACGDDGPTGIDTAVIPVTPEQMSAVTFIANGASAKFDVKDGQFSAGPGGTAESAALLNASDTTFPVLAYRVMSDASPTNPDFGLVASRTAQPPKECGSGCHMFVTDTAGKTYELTVGAQTFNYAGYYASVEDDPRVFLLISATVAQLISMATGRPFAFPRTQQELQLDAKTQQLAEEAQGRGDPAANYDPYLRQVLAAEQDKKAAEQNKPGGALRKAATSTQDQLGSANDQSTAPPVANDAGPEGTDG